MVIMGIDPGIVVTGYSVLQRDDKGAVRLLDCGFIKQSSLQPIPERLSCIYTTLDDIIKRFSVCAISLETPFLGKNAQNFLKLGYVRGIIYLLACHSSLKLFEFSPCEVKRAITGFGGSDKDQLARVIFRLFPGIVAQRFDVTDAVALSLCGIWVRTS